MSKVEVMLQVMGVHIQQITQTLCLKQTCQEYVFQGAKGNNIFKHKNHNKNAK